MSKFKSNKKIHISNPIKRKPNWTATILVIFILGVIYCYFGGDLGEYNQAAMDRAELAKQAEQAVLFETGLDMRAIEEKMQEINQRVQNLNDSTDLGEYFAENDLTVEGRKTNEMVRNLITVSVVALVAYVVLNFIRVFWWAASNRKSLDSGKFSKVDS